MKEAIIVREKLKGIVKMLTSKDIRVTQQGTQAYVQYHPNGTPKRVNVPYIPEDADTEFLRAIEGFLDHEVAHVLFTDYKVLAEAKKQNVSGIHNAIEDVYIEKMMSRAYAGSAFNLSNTQAFFFKHFAEKGMRENPGNEATYLLVPALRALGGQSTAKDFMDGKWGYIDPVIGKLKSYLEEHMPKMESSADALAISLKLRELLDDDEPEEPTAARPSSGKPMSGGGSRPSGRKERMEAAKPVGGKAPEKEADDADEPKEGEGEGDDEGKGEGEGEGSKPPEMAAAKPGGEGEGEGEPEPEGDEDEPAPGEELPEELPEETPAGAAEDELDSEEEDESFSGYVAPLEDAGECGGADEKAAKITFGELEEMAAKGDFDEGLSDVITSKSVDITKASSYAIFTTDHDVIEPLPVDGRDTSRAVKVMTDKVDHMVGPLQKDLERAVAARSHANWSGGHRSGRLNGSAIAKLAVFKDERAFKRRHINTTKDVAVSLLVDCSGSMSGTKIEVAAHAAYALASVLERLNISCEALGFTTGRSMSGSALKDEEKHGIAYARVESLYMPILKGFNERMTVEARGRFAILPSGGFLANNVDGECVQIAATRLSMRREERKILIVLSDGRPAAMSRAGSGSLDAHLKQTVRDVEKGGVDVLGIGIQDSSVKNFYSKSVVLNNVSDLPTVVIQRVRQLLGV